MGGAGCVSVIYFTLFQLGQLGFNSFDFDLCVGLFFTFVGDNLFRCAVDKTFVAEFCRHGFKEALGV